MLLFCIAVVGSQAQSIGVKTDRNQLLIGERLQYELLVNLPSPGYAINFKFPNSLAHFDVLESNNFDTINSNGSFQVHKKIVFTSFDSGSWYIPSFEVLVEHDNQSQKFLTDSLLVNVGYSPADSTGELRDIKPVIEVTVKDYFWYYVAAVVLLGLIVAWVIYIYIRNTKRKSKKIFNSPFSAYDEAMKALQDLKKLDLQDPVQTKEYHTSLAEIFKRYYSRRQGKNMLNKTTGDILIGIKEHYEDAGLLSAIAEALRCADAVKFAKYIPAVSESGQSYSQVKETIDLIEKLQSPPIQ